jgi:hypothetical protein
MGNSLNAETGAQRLGERSRELDRKHGDRHHAGNMNPDSRPAIASNRSVAVLATGLFLLMAVFHLGNALVGYSYFRDIHLGTALEYASGRIDLLRPMIVGFNATDTPTAQELPLWQAAAGLAFKLAGSRWFGWANLTSLLLFGTCLWPLLRLAQEYLGARGGWWALVFFLAQPLIVVEGGQAGTDGFALATEIWFLYCASRLVSTAQWRWWAPAALFGCLAAVSKLPFFMAAGLGVCFLLLSSPEQSKSWRAWLLLSSAGLVSAVVFVVWTKYTDYLLSLAVFPYVELRVGQNQDMVRFYFGDWHYRLSPLRWGQGAWRALNCTMGSFALVFLPLAGLFAKNSRLAKCLLWGGFVTVLVFTSLVLVHRHYYLMICPAVAILSAAGMVRLEQLLPEGLTRSLAFTAGTGVVLVLTVVQGLMGIKALGYDPYRKEIVGLLRQHTKPADKLVILGGGWGGYELFASERKGLSVQMPETLTRLCAGENLRRLQSLGFNRLVMLSESRQLAAVQTANPGARHQRGKYPASVSSAVDAWPVVFQNEDIIIKEIPPRDTTEPSGTGGK